MNQELAPANVDTYLFREGLTISDYWIERTPVSEVVCYTNRDGRAFDLHISDGQLAERVKARLLALGVRIVRSEDTR